VAIFDDHSVLARQIEEALEAMDSPGALRSAIPDPVGNTVAVVTVPVSACAFDTPTDRPAVRALTA
jgi:hypothetical protein